MTMEQIEDWLLRAQMGQAAEVAGWCEDSLRAAPGPGLLHADQWVRFVRLVALAEMHDLATASAVAQDIATRAEHASHWRLLGRAARSSLITMKTNLPLGFDELVATIVRLEPLVAERSGPPDVGASTPDDDTDLVVAFAVNLVDVGLTRLGLFEQTLQWVDRLTYLAGRVGSTELQLVAAMNAAEVAWENACESELLGDRVGAEGRFQAARSSLVRARTICASAGYPPNTQHSLDLGLLALDVMIEPTADALDRLHHALETMDPGLRTPYPAMAWLALARRYADLGARSEALRHLRSLEQNDAFGKVTPFTLLAMASLCELVEESRDIADFATHRRMVDRLLEDWQHRRTSDDAAYESRLEAARLHLRDEERARQFLVDPLTGVGNRRLIDQLLADLTTPDGDQTPVTVCFVDVDDFKQINENHSHLTGDLVLREIAATMRRRLDPGAVVARYGGDEFVVVFPGTAVEAACNQLEQLIDHVSAAAWEEQGLRLTDIGLSAGVAQAWPGATAKELLRQADAALLEAKRAGKQRILVAPRPCEDPRVSEC